MGKEFRSKIKKLRWVDILGILIFFFILLFSVFFFLRRPDYVTLTVRLLERNDPDFYFNRPRPWYVENIEIGLKETDQIGRTVVEVIDVERYPSGNLYHDVYATVVVRSIFNKKTKQHSYNGLPLLIGDFRTFKLEDLLLSGVIVDINTDDKLREKKKFIVNGYLDPINYASTSSETESIKIDGIKNYLADEVIPGLEIVDNKGEILVKLVSVNKSAGTISFPSGSSYVSVSDPDRTLVEVTFEIVTEKISDNYYYQKEKSLTVGDSIVLTFDDIRIQPTITSVTEIE